jgi:hypothetical protein
MKSANEQSACQGFIAILNILTGMQYEKIESPDDRNRQTPDVDFLLESNGGERDTIAVEHTILESFERQIRYVNRSYDIVESINDGCKNSIPADRYYFLGIPPGLVDSLVGKIRKHIIVALITWVENSVQDLRIDNNVYTDYEGHKISLICGGSHPQLNGNVWRAPLRPENDEILQAQRFSRAIKDKLPKLWQYKKRNIKTALLLEDIASIASIISLRDSGISSDDISNIKEYIDYLVVFVSNKDRMVVGNVWKEMAVWYSEIPDDRRFSFYQIPGQGTVLKHNSNNIS